MDDLLNEFLNETKENLDQLDVELVKLEQEPNNPELLGSIFRVMHTIKGTCGFLGLPRLEHIAHAAENVLGRIRDGKLEVTAYAISMILESLDQIKFIISVLEDTSVEPEGEDEGLIAALNQLASGEAPAGDGDAGGDAAPTTVAATGDAGSAVESEQPSETAAPEAVVSETVAAAPAPKPAKVPAKAVEAKPAAAARDDGDKNANQSIRVGVDLLENLMNMVSELVLTRNQLLQISRSHKDNEFTVPLQRLSHVTSELQEGVMKTRMQPIGNAWNKLPRIIRDLANELNKKIDLVMVGEDTELDRQVLELIKDPLTHMVRNSADHGIEGLADRKAAGKNETGTIKLEAYHEGGHIIISIADDGKGLNLDRIKEKALSNGLATVDELAAMADSQIHQFIFKAGFSTAAAVTSVSGRGVGMDVVRTNIEKIGGTIELTSAEGKGSTFMIKIPLTLAIVSALIVGVGEERFAIPQLSVVELVRVTKGSDHKIETINGSPVLRLRDRLLPLVSLRKVLDIAGPDENEGGKSMFIVVTQVGVHSFGMIVDRVYDTEEIVVKPVSPILRHISLFSGNTILGDGSVIMILDPNGIAAKTGELSGNETGLASKADALVASNDDQVSFLVFNAGSKSPFAVPLALIARLEEVEIKKIEFSNGQPLVQYRGSLMPLVTISKDYAIPEDGVLPVLVFSDANRSMGLIVDNIIDIVEESARINLPTDSEGLLGSMILRGVATDLIDAHYYMKLAFADWFKTTTKRSEGAQKTSGRRVLLVDDSAFFRNLLVPVLTVSGYEVVALENPLAAIKLREAGEMFDLIVSDIEMPEMDGLTFARNVKGDPSWNRLPLLALSSFSNPEDMLKAKNAGFDDYVPKFDRDALLQTIDRVLNGVAVAA